MPKTAKCVYAVLPRAPSPPRYLSCLFALLAAARTIGIRACRGLSSRTSSSATTPFAHFPDRQAVLAFLRILQNLNILSFPQDPIDPGDSAAIAKLLGSPGDVSFVVQYPTGKRTRRRDSNQGEIGSRTECFLPGACLLRPRCSPNPMRVRDKPDEGLISMHCGNTEYASAAMTSRYNPTTGTSLASVVDETL